MTEGITEAELPGASVAESPATGIYRGRRRRVRRRVRSPVTASFLSFIWPGFGQWYARQPRRALLYALPPALLVFGLLTALALAPEVFVLRLLAPSFALAVIALIGLHAVWRVASVVDAWWNTRREPLVRDRAVPVVVLLSLVILASHGLAAYYVQSFGAAGEQIFGGDTAGPVTGPLDDILAPLATQPPETPGTPGSTPVPGASPTAVPATPEPTSRPAFNPDQRVTVLFVGVDSGPGRDHALTDTLIAASFDPATNQIAMISVPRDTGRIPMYDGGIYEDRINSLLGFARNNPDRFPQGPVYALVREMEYLIGTPIDYYAVTDMAGLQATVDLVGGVDINVATAINDVGVGLVLEPGRYHMDGELALKYARSRHGPGNNDFERARRQQQIIYALGQRVKDPAVLARLPQVLDAAAGLVRSDIPVEYLPEFLGAFEQMQDASTRQIVLSPSRYAERIPPAEVGGRYMIELKMDAVAALSIELFGPESRYAAP